MAGLQPLGAEDSPVSVPTQRIVPPGTGFGLERSGAAPFSVPKEGSPLSAEPSDPVEGIGEGPGHVTDPDAKVPEVRYGTDALPAPVRETRDKLVAAAKTGDLAAIAGLIKAMPTPPTLTSLDDGSDPAEVLAAQSGDAEGREILAILLDVLDAGWVRMGEGTADDRYVWPYFAQYPVEKLTGPQMVELYRIITAADFEEMQNAGAYVFYRVEIGADGRWQVFQAGE